MGVFGSGWHAKLHLNLPHYRVECRVIHSDMHNTRICEKLNPGGHAATSSPAPRTRRTISAKELPQPFASRTPESRPVLLAMHCTAPQFSAHRDITSRSRQVRMRRCPMKAHYERSRRAQGNAHRHCDERVDNRAHRDTPCSHCSHCSPRARPFCEPIGRLLLALPSSSITRGKGIAVSSSAFSPHARLARWQRSPRPAARILVPQTITPSTLGAPPPS
jgi:hypothetical protein